MQICAIELINKKEIDNLEVKDIINELGISRPTYYRWLKNKKLRNTVRTDINNELKLNLPAVRRTLLKNALQGDIRAIQIFLKKYDNTDDDSEDYNMTPDKIIRIIKKSKKSETNNVID
jgi:AcrR family transcriptional regulator